MRVRIEEAAPVQYATSDRVEMQAIELTEVSDTEE